MKAMTPFLSLSLCLLLTACSQTDQPEAPKDRLERHQKAVFQQSNFIDDKTYEVFLPLSYAEKTEKRYPVLYMMDRQNLFVDSLAYGGVAWNIDEVADSLVRTGTIKEFIMVGVDHAAEHRFSEYMPQKPVEALPQAFQDALNKNLEKPVFSDSFLQFLTKELKPLIDRQYRTLSDSDHTFIGGSSMGGLISMYALCEYPEVFGGALCLSTHWPISMDDSSPQLPAQLIQYFSDNLPQGKKWYFDHGTRGLDQYYEPYQQRVDSILVANGYIEGENFISRQFEGHDHNERDWNRRVHIPLEFAFGKK